MLTTLGFIALVVGVVLLVVGYVAQPRAIRPGWVAVAVGLLLVLLGYLFVGADYHTAAGLLTQV